MLPLPSESGESLSASQKRFFSDIKYLTALRHLRSQRFRQGWIEFDVTPHRRRNGEDRIVSSQSFAVRTSNDDLIVLNCHAICRRVQKNALATNRFSKLLRELLIAALTHIHFRTQSNIC